jgi:hypothetical protein
MVILKNAFSWSFFHHILRMHVLSCKKKKYYIQNQYLLKSKQTAQLFAICVAAEVPWLVKRQILALRQ